MDKKKLIIKPTGGFGNRVRAIMSAVQMAADQQRELIVLWEKKWEINAYLSDLFAPQKFKIINKDRYNFPNRYFAKLTNPELAYRKTSRVFDEPFMYAFVKENNSYDFSKYFAAYSNEESIFIQTCFRFYPYNEFKFIDYFKPNMRLQNAIDAAKVKLGKDYVAMHIRRTDHEDAIALSPDSLFENAIENAPVQQKFFLCTDDPKVETKFISKFGEARIFVNSTDKSRDTLSGIIQAMVDLWLLAGASKIYGSFTSTFSSLGAEIGNVPLEILEAEKN